MYKILYWFLQIGFGGKGIFFEFESRKMDRRVEQFRNVYTNSCFDLRIEPLYSILDQLKTLAISYNPERLDLSSHNLGAKVGDI